MKVGKLLLQWMTDEDEYGWDDFVASFTTILKKKNPNAYWYAEVENFGWMKQNCYQYFKFEDGNLFLRTILPTTDCHFKIFNWGKGVAIQNYHHDSPTGDEWYYIKPISEKVYEENT